jgi:hypothetical protein
LILLPYQPVEISLVGFRGCVFFLPAAILGSRLGENDCMTVATAVAFLDIFVFIIAIGEYIWGIEAFFPRNPVTDLIYRMNYDVAGYTAYRIPATFSTAAVYGGTLILTLPFLYGAWASKGPGAGGRYRFLFGIAMLTVFVGVLLSACRMPFVVLALSILFAFGSRAVSRNRKIALLFLAVCVSVLAATNGRLQRFTTLQDTDAVEGRIHGSVNRSFWEVFFEYPLGNGLGGGGTSIPYFWQDHVRHPIALENDYARILLEQTVVGLLLWIAFLFWIFWSLIPFRRTPWREGRRLAWFICLVFFVSSMIGIGLLTSVPGGFVVFLSIGWFSRSPETAVWRQCTRSRYQLPISPLRIREAT